MTEPRTSLERLEQQIAFVLEIDRLKHVLRRNRLADGSRRENDVEHSWHLAMMALLLAEHSPRPIDTLHVMHMALIHDLVEIDAGDTCVYHSAARAEAAAAERAAADRIFGMLPSDQAAAFRAVWDEFEEGVTAEAQFARALDRLQPILMNDASEGAAWRELGVTYEQVRELNLPLLRRGAPVFAALIDGVLGEAKRKGYFAPDPVSDQNPEGTRSQ